MKFEIPTIQAPIIQVPEVRVVPPQAIGGSIPRVDMVPSYRAIQKPLGAPGAARVAPANDEDEGASEEESGAKQTKSIAAPTVKVPELTEVTSSEIVDYIEVPFINQSVPIPSEEIMVTAAGTAVISVGATLSATALFKRLVSIMKPVLKLAVKKVMAYRAGRQAEVRELSFGRKRLMARRMRIME